MPERWLSEADRSRFIDFPAEIPAADVITFFTLQETDLQFIRLHYGAAGRLGVALQLSALRYFGSVPDDLMKAPFPVVGFLARQLEVAPEALSAYGQRSQTRTEHLRESERHLGFHKAAVTEKNELARWLRERALEHDRPLLLLQLLCERLHAQKIVRPGLTLLERAVTTARQQAQTTTWELLAPLLSAPDREKLAQQEGSCDKT